MSYQKKTCAEKALHQLEKCLLQLMESDCNNDETMIHSSNLIKMEIERLKVEIENEREKRALEQKVSA